MELINDIMLKQQELDISIKQLRKNGTAYAEAERAYKILLRQEALKLRNNDNMPVTLINQIIYGIKEVAEARFKRDVAETIYHANQEAINSIKLQLRLLDSQVNREFGNPNLGKGS